MAVTLGDRHSERIRTVTEYRQPGTRPPGVRASAAASEDQESPVPVALER
jgi:hypothetical protein